jgi:DNA ligase-associated metallophosphoesterase
MSDRRVSDGSASDGAVPLVIQGETLLLHPGRAALWPRRKTVIVADTHFGKSSFFGRHGIAVPAGSDEEDRAGLTRLVTESGGERLIILGDFLHAPIAADSREAHDLDAWSRSLAGVHIIVVAGNHDRGALRLWSSIAWQGGELIEPPFRFVHHAEHRRGADSLYALSGHIHPVMRIRAFPKPGMRVPVFWQRSAGLVLPSFGAFTGGFAVRPVPGEHLFAVGPTAVTPMT